MRGGVMVCGTASDVGKTHIVTGLCRLLARRGVRVAPFKAQNMSLNSWVTESGHEIGRAQGVQALASGAEPEVAMNPVLLKPTGDRASQVVALGTAIAHVDAAAYYRDHLPGLRDLVAEQLDGLRRRFDVVVAEGAGGAAEINLLDHDLGNLPLAHAAALPAILVGDIERGGVFAALYGTVALAPEPHRRLLRGLVINKFRGDPDLLGTGPADLERRCGVATLGVLPWMDDVGLDAEDSLALAGPWARSERSALGDRLDVAAVRFPRIANFTDLDALAVESGVDVRMVTRAGALGRPDLVVLPGTKATVADLEWLRQRGLDEAIRSCGATVLGICGGAQMMGRRIIDHVESGRGDVHGLGWLDGTTTFLPDKVTRRRRGRSMGATLTGYQIHHGRMAAGPAAEAWIDLEDAATKPEGEGVADPQAGLFATSLHGLFEEDGFRSAFLGHVADRAGKHYEPDGVAFAAVRQSRFDRLADSLEDHLDLDRLFAVIEDGGLRS
ncbi:MAG: cobyric acid synthase [Actinobacteria bacterium]|nr:cobyric acid synthase [Actinomycetota bacterium]